MRDLPVVSELGEGEDLVVLLHGVLDRARSFDGVVDRLAGECRMLTYDRRGYGRSVDLFRPPGDIDTHVRDLLDALDGRSAVVVAHSFSGVTAVAAAIQRPELFRSLVLYETAMAWVPGWDDRSMTEMLFSADPERNGLVMMFGDRLHTMDPARLPQLLGDARAFVAEERAVRTGPPPFDTADLKVPLLYALGDTEMFEVVANHLAGTVPDVEVARIPGAGHNAHRTHPDEFADLIRRGLAGARAAEQGGVSW